MARFVMCPPKYYAIEYEINPWMSRMHGAVPGVAEAQWENLHATLSRRIGAQIELIEPAPGLPDLVFTANAGVVEKDLFVVSRFRFPVRSGEEPIFKKWFADHGYRVAEVPEGVFFEGAGDMLRCGEHLFAGYHFRSDLSAHTAVS